MCIYIECVLILGLLHYGHLNVKMINTGYNIVTVIIIQQSDKKFYINIINEHREAHSIEVIEHT